MNQLEVLNNRQKFLKESVIGDLNDLPNLSEKSGLIYIIDAVYNTVRMMDLKHMKDVDQRLKYIWNDFSINSKNKIVNYLSAEDKTEFGKQKDKCAFLTENKDLMEEVLQRIEKENNKFELVAEVAAEFKSAKDVQSNCMAIATDNKETLRELKDSITENVTILIKNQDHLTKRVEALK